jgi:hypothetical protein
MTFDAQGQATPAKVAAFMVRELGRTKTLYQSVIAYKIREEFGESFVAKKNDALIVRQEVLDAFKRLTADSVVWDPLDRHWRQRTSRDQRDERP